jgi:MtN3 and saliva related transmembrane protein
MTLLSALATIFGVINGLANVPQIYKIFKTKSAGDISVLTYSLLTVGSFVWVLYGIEIMNIPVLVMNSLAFLEFVIVLIGCRIYNKK